MRAILTCVAAACIAAQLCLFAVIVVTTVNTNVPTFLTPKQTTVVFGVLNMVLTSIGIYVAATNEYVQDKYRKIRFPGRVQDLSDFDADLDADAKVPV